MSRGVGAARLPDKQNEMVTRFLRVGVWAGMSGAATSVYLARGNTG
ncbi:hypothetical protein SAMN06295955_11189 [Sphingopyxis indica]|uniref:Uncharacterized protein n=2 Tax=Sphingopyxis indica TaxID=436663 RepID=A0A239JW56_9SPHN|nr:hypothetical protein SAMN06295955_11189 [Sphingopyxis indica]